jgi:hypothetical protein
MKYQAISKKAKMIEQQFKVLKSKLDYISRLNCGTDDMLKELESYHNNLGKSLDTIKTFK